MSKITILSSPNAVAAKTITPNGFVPFDKKARQFYFSEVNVASIFDIASLMERLEQRKSSFVIRGEPTADAIPGALVTRRKNAKEGMPAHFRDAKRSYLMIDIDDLRAPDGMDPTSVEAVEFSIRQLPSEFHDATVYFQFSASAGFKGQGISLHLWYWLDRPVDDVALRTWAKEYNSRYGSKLIDWALFQGVQPHYTAGPIIVELADPVAKRSGLIEKSVHEVALVLPTAKAPTTRVRAKSEDIGDLSAEYRLSKIGDQPGGEGFHTPLLGASWALVAEHGIEERNAIKEILRNAISCADRSAHSDAEISRYTSDEYLDEIIEGAAEKQKVRVSKTSTEVEPYFDIDEVSAEDGTSKLREIIRKFLAEPADTVVRITTGAGKTSTFAYELMERDANVGPGFIFVPNHRLADELRKQMLSTNSQIKIQVIEGRNAANCKAHDKVEMITAAGMPVMKTACISRRETAEGTEIIKCPFFDQCQASGYMSQFNDRADIYILASSYLGVNVPESLPKPRWVMIDEAFYSHLIDCVEIRRADIAVGPGRELGLSIMEGLKQKRDALEAFRSSGFNIEDLKNASGFHYGQWQKQFSQIDPSLSEAWHYQNLKPLNPAVHLFSAISKAVKGGADSCPQILLRSRDGEDFIVVASMKPLWKKAPVLNLDATADERIMSYVLPDHDFHHIDVRQKMRVTQVYDHRVSKASLTLDDEADRLVARCQAVIDRHAQTYKRALVVTYKKVKDRFLLPAGWGLEHFGAIRGLDMYKDVDAVFVIGNNRSDVGAIEAAAAALMSNNGEGPLTWTDKLPEQMRGYRTSSGAKFGVLTPVHPDSLVQALMEQGRESETLQAIGRARAIHGRTDPVDVFLVSSVPINVTVDRLLTLDELGAGGTVLERLAQRWEGVVPASARWLSINAPDIFKNEKGAENWVKRNWAHFTNGIYSNVSFIQGTYKVSGQRGPTPTRFIALADHRAPRAMLEEHVGTVVQYEGPADTYRLDYLTFPQSDRRYYYYDRGEDIGIPDTAVYYGSKDLMEALNDPITHFGKKKSA